MTATMTPDNAVKSTKPLPLERNDDDSMVINDTRALSTLPVGTLVIEKVTDTQFRKVANQRYAYVDEDGIETEIEWTPECFQAPVLVPLVDDLPQLVTHGPSPFFEDTLENVPVGSIAAMITATAEDELLLEVVEHEGEKAFAPVTAEGTLGEVRAASELVLHFAIFFAHRSQVDPDKVQEFCECEDEEPEAGEGQVEDLLEALGLDTELKLDMPELSPEELAEKRVEELLNLPPGSVVINESGSNMPFIKLEDGNYVRFNRYATVSEMNSMADLEGSYLEANIIVSEHERLVKAARRDEVAVAYIPPTRGDN